MIYIALLIKTYEFASESLIFGIISKGLYKDFYS